MDNFPRTALNCRNLSCNNTMRTGEIYIDGFCGGCYGNRNKVPDGLFYKGKEYRHSGMREPNKNFNRFLSIMELSQKYPSENTLFIGKRTVESISEVADFVNLKWHIYIDMDYEKLTRESFVGKFKVLGVIDNEV